jgi:DAK2 domain fusion protein YloV
VLIKLNGAILYNMFRRGLMVLEENREAVDILNVFPVPDGDTGTNMVLTMRSALKEMEKAESNNLPELVQAASLGSLMGARGNSGVILSQLLRGFAKGLEGKTEVNALEFAQAMQIGVNTAYKAVMKPVEGTILTVSREAAQGALEIAKKSNDILAVLDAAVTNGEEALLHTPDLLPVLKRAGVVDAGGKGFIFILRGLREAADNAGEDKDLEGQPTDSVRPEIKMDIARLTQSQPAAESDSVIEFQYCTEVIVKGQQLPLEQLRQDLALLGDCLLVVGTEQLAKVHLHSNNPGLVLENCLKFGSLHQIKVDNMQEQHRVLGESGLVRDLAQSESISAETIDVAAKPVVTNDSAQDQFSHRQIESPSAIISEQVDKKVGLVAVAVGQGIGEILRSLGVDEVVEGGQTMNPSIEDLVQAINRISTSQVIILPNNSNIILAAEQAANLVEKEVKVVPTRSLAQSISALVAFDLDASLEDNYQSMLAGSKRAKSGEVTCAVRDCQLDDLDIKANQIIGIANGTIKVAGEDPAQVVKDLLQQMVEEEDEIITIFYGEDVEANQAEELAAALSQDFPNCEIELHQGGQPLYHYYIAVE